MRALLFTLTVASVALADNPIPSAAVSKEAWALAKVVYSPEQHTKQIEAGVSSTLAQVSKSGVKVDEAKVRAAFNQVLPYQELLELQAGLLAKYYTQTELGELAKFYGTPLGKKSLAVMPQLSQDVMGVMMQKLSDPATQQIIRAAVSPPSTAK